jgi:hypothetical protein
MSDEQSTATGWRYFGRDSRVGNGVIEIYRCPSNGKPVHQQRLEDVHLLLKDGTWRTNMRNALNDELLKGWFDEADDELSEQQAISYYQAWLASGRWPGRD